MITERVDPMGRKITPGLGAKAKRAEGVGFEPTVGSDPTPVFKTGALNRSAIPPSCGMLSAARTAGKAMSPGPVRSLRHAIDLHLQEVDDRAGEEHRADVLVVHLNRAGGVIAGGDVHFRKQRHRTFAPSEAVIG